MSGKYQKNNIPWNKGLSKTIDSRLSQSEATRKKHSEKMRDRWKDPIWREHISRKMTGHSVSPETREKIGRANKKTVYSLEENRKNAQRMKTKWQDIYYVEKQIISRNSPEHKEKIKNLWARENNPMWKGGYSKLPYALIWGNKLREEIRKRDEYICGICGLPQEKLSGWTKKLDIHHKDYDPKNCQADNLVALCRRCHLKTNFNRNQWKIFFNIAEKLEK
jgi:5-methylcytosine-specific restriction endonuclease McrA